MTKAYRLSKSRIAAFLQCPKRFWLEVHRPELRQETPEMQAAFAVGHRVGDLARAEYPDGVLVSHDDDLRAALKETGDLFARRRRTPVFEATFAHAGVLVRADVMIPSRRGWHMAEVKSAGEAKPYHLNDLAVQTWVACSAGVRVERATVRHIDKAFIYPGGDDYRGLLVDAEVGDELQELLPEVPKWVVGARSTLGKREPRRELGDHCDDPFECPFKAYCESLAAPQPDYPVELLPGQRGKKLARQFREEGFEDLRAVPAKRLDDAKFRRMHAATLTGSPYRDARGAKKILATWPHPWGFLDFETLNLAVPVWKGTRPFEQIPFQWSCHFEGKNGSVKHCEFLDLTGNNPARACAERLIADLAGCRSIVAYRASTERGVIMRLAGMFPDLRRKLLSLADRVQDLLPVVREHYYHRDMLGSFSIKAVLPTLAPELDYSELGEVQDGTAAQRAYDEAVHPSTTPERKAKIERALRRYCALDSRAMVVVARALARHH